MTELNGSSSKVDIKVAKLDFCISLPLLVLDLASRAFAKSFRIGSVASTLSRSLLFVNLTRIPTDDLTRRGVSLAQFFILRLHVLILAAGKQQAEHEHCKHCREHLHEEVQEWVRLDAVHDRALDLKVSLAHILVRLVLVDTCNFVCEVALLEEVIGHKVKDTLFTWFALCMNRD